MSTVKCFECGKDMYYGENKMKELIRVRLPVFCCTHCSINFPDNGTPEFDKRIKEWKDKV